MNNVLPISYFVNTTVSALQPGLQNKNVANVLFLTTDLPNNSDEFRVYNSPRSVGEDYGTTSDTFLMATALFNPSPNINTANGRLIIAPLNSPISATKGTLTGADLTANMNAIKAVSDGKIRIRTNGATYDIFGLNFSSVSTSSVSNFVTDLVKVLKNSINQVSIEATTNSFKMTSKKYGADSAVEIQTLSTGTGTDLSAAGLLNAVAAVLTTGVNSSGETIQNAITRLQDKVDFVPIVSNLKMESSLVLPLAQFINARDNMYIEVKSNVEALSEEFLDIKQANLKKYRTLFYSSDLTMADKFKFAYIGLGFSTNYNAQNTALTMNLKTLSGILPDGDLTNNLISLASNCGADVYGNFGGVAKVKDHGANGFFDDVVNTLDLKLLTDITLFNALARTNSKVPQTEVGMNYLKASLENVYLSRVRAGVIGTGLVWNSADTFGDPATFRRNITESGFYVYSLPIAQQSQTDRETRKAPVIQVAIKFSGAIHSVDVIINIEN